MLPTMIKHTTARQPQVPYAKRRGRFDGTTWRDTERYASLILKLYLLIQDLVVLDRYRLLVMYSRRLHPPQPMLLRATYPSPSEPQR